jgi:aspartate beta-hydroxylase
MTDGAQRIAALLSEAAAARQAGNALAEITALDEALQLAPADPRVLNARGMAALTAGDATTARMRFEAAAAADPGERALWMNVATACRAQGDDDAERTALEHVLNIDRLDFMGQLRLAELHDRTGNVVGAALGWSNVVQLATQIEPRPPVIADALARGQAFLTAHNARTAAKIDAALGAKITAMGSTARRFQACVDHGLGRRAIYQNECAGVFYPFLPADEFFDRDHFHWFAELEAKTDAIRAEALALFANGGVAIRPYVRMEKGGPETIWSGLDGSLDWSACFLWEYGVRNDPVCAICPETAAALERVPQNHIPGKAPSAFFSLLKPGAHIPPHTGVTNTRAIIHLPLVVPDGCRFRVGGETRVWREGEAFAFDDTIQHEAWNDSDKTRIVLIFDVWNPHLTADEQALLSDYFALTGARPVSA